MIKFEYYEMPAADLGPESPLPNLKSEEGIVNNPDLGEDISAEDRQYFGVGFAKTFLPYKRQDGYNRDRKMRKFKAAVVENDYIKAIFLPELGGRLWSLFDKKAQKELLYVNSVFQPCNLAVRNAWFSGGVEFNVGVRGHNPLTCSPMYCEIGRTSEGEEILTLYEFERIRGVSYSISAYLPKNSRTLYLNMKIENRNDEEKYMYWWSNIAYPEKKDTRVIVPANEMFRFYYENGGYRVRNFDFPVADGVDFSFPQNIYRSQDFFYRIPENEQKWIAATDSTGTGLLQYSTDFLKGRKLFLWGMGQGGRHWNEFLSNDGEAYIEIQAGILRTQLEHIPMPANTEWTWTEAYTMLEADPEVMMGDDYNRMVKEVEKCIVKKIDDVIDSFPTDIVYSEVVFQGSGWGVLENAIRDKEISKYYNYTNTKDTETQQWFYLLENGRLPVHNVSDEPESYVIGKFWQEKLEAIADKTWYEHYQLGVIYYEAERYDDALGEWKKSVAKEENCWAYRCIAVMASDLRNDGGMACENVKKAYALKPDCLTLCREYARILVAYGCGKDFISDFDNIPESLQRDSRVLLNKAKALLDEKRFEDAAAIINEDFDLPDNRECEIAVSDIWSDIYKGIYGDDAEKIAPLPKHLDFRMDG